VLFKKYQTPTNHAKSLTHPAKAGLKIVFSIWFGGLVVLVLSFGSNRHIVHLNQCKIMKNINIDLPISKPLFRFNDMTRSAGNASTNTSWTITTRTTTTCIYDMALPKD
jgi:hypothetical protein